MLKKEITYEDFEGNTVTETVWFNLSKPELLDLQYGAEGGSLADYITKIVAETDMKKMFDLFKAIVLAAYGEKSQDGKRFIKEEGRAKEFTQTAAYVALMEELFDAEKLATFLLGIIPKDLAVQVEAATNQAANPAEIGTVPPKPPGVLPHG